MTTFFVPGTPRPWSAPNVGKGGGFSKAEMIAWEKLVRDVSLYRGRRVEADVLEVVLEFRLPREDKMAKKLREKLADQKDLPHTRTPDLDNLTKAVLDGLRYKKARANSRGHNQPGLILDDAAVASLAVKKFWTDDGQPPGVHVTIRAWEK